MFVLKWLWNGDGYKKIGSTRAGLRRGAFCMSLTDDLFSNTFDRNLLGWAAAVQANGHREPEGPVERWVNEQGRRAGRRV